jgi:hypothetical protein
MRGSVDRALEMQPKRTSVVRDELLYASPSVRELVAEIADAGQRLVEGGLAPRTLGAIAVRRTESIATRTAPKTDLANIDNRMLQSAPIAVDDPVTGALVHDHAAILCWPPALSGLAEPLDPVPSLAAWLPPIADEPGSGRLVRNSDGSWLAIAPTVSDAIEWIEIAEHAASLQSRRTP